MHAQTSISNALGVSHPGKWFERNWFATRNFHGQWYSDSERLEQLVPFRRDTFQEALSRAVQNKPNLKVAGRVPGWIVKNLIMKPLTLKPRGTMAYLQAGNKEALSAYFGSQEEWEVIGGWDTFWPARPSRTPSFLDHGYDETKPAAQWTTEDYQAAASFRGGELTSRAVPTGDIATPLSWRCAFGHDFEGSPRLILTAGHWCPDCVKQPLDYPRQAKQNAFLAQLELPHTAKAIAIP